MRIGTCIAGVLAILSAAPTVEAADLTTRQVIEALQRAAPDAPADFAGLDLKFLDLSELDFSHANLAGADLRSADLTGAKLCGSRPLGREPDARHHHPGELCRGEPVECQPLSAGHLFQRRRRPVRSAGLQGREPHRRPGSSCISSMPI